MYRSQKLRATTQNDRKDWANNKFQYTLTRFSTLRREIEFKGRQKMARFRVSQKYNFLHNFKKLMLPCCSPFKTGQGRLGRYFSKFPKILCGEKANQPKISICEKSGFGSGSRVTKPINEYWCMTYQNDRRTMWSSNMLVVLADFEFGALKLAKTRLKPKSGFCKIKGVRNPVFFRKIIIFFPHSDSRGKVGY
jgi:hypothetical protein